MGKIDIDEIEARHTWLSCAEKDRECVTLFIEERDALVRVVKAARALRVCPFCGAARAGALVNEHPNLHAYEHHGEGCPLADIGGGD